MIIKVDTANLCAGMYVVNTSLPWDTHPRVYSVEGEIPSVARVANILREGYTEAFIDTGKGSFVFTSPPVGGTIFDLGASPGPSKAKPPAPPPLLAPLALEVENAKALYTDTLTHAKDFLHRAQEEKLADIDCARDMVEELMGSIVRNRDALVSLCKLQTYDEYTYTHSVNVCVLSLAFGHFLGMAPSALRDLGLSAMCHDLGKTAIASAILNKPDRLTETEFAEIRRHPSLGRDMAQKAGAQGMILRGVAEHHEKHNGRGYPAGLAGLAISLYGRCIALSDIYDALTSRRVYKEALSPFKTLCIMFGMRGEDFSAELLDRFIACLGIFPVGCLVRLSNGEHALVTENNPGLLLKPKVRVILDQRLRPLPPEDVDLASARRGGAELFIVDTVDAALQGVDALAALGSGLPAPERRP